MLELILVRHGETESNKAGTYLGWTDIGLNENGINQVRLLRDKLANAKIQRILTSPLKRAVQTAEIINESCKAEIRYIEELKEINFGLWDNMTFQEIQNKFPKEHKKWLENSDNYHFPEGESAAELYERVSKVIEQLTAKEKDVTILLVTHQGVIRNIISYLLVNTREDSWHFKVDNCGITKIEITDGYAVLTKLNG